MPSHALNENDMNTKLPQEFKDKWIAALRSGEYKQGKMRLYRSEDNTYCCLGVACAINGIPNELLTAAGTIPAVWDAFDNMPKTIRGHAIDNEIVAQLIKMNDNKTEPYSFNQIADYIEANL